MTEQCEKRFDKIDDSIEKIDKSIRGNGKPGLKQRVDNLEAANKRRSHTIMLILSVAGTILSPVITALIIKNLIGK